jgi:hypothetical protein
MSESKTEYVVEFKRSGTKKWWLSFCSSDKTQAETSYAGFTVVTFVADESVKSDPESMGLVEQLSDAVGVEFGKPSKVSNRTLDAVVNLTKRIESGEPIHGKRVTVEQTPDGPLATFEDVVI